MNYRHIFHAGNICDVAKHTVLLLLLEHLREKDKGFFVLDTHAGTGLYDLQDARAAKTSEAQDGILKLLQAEPLPGLENYYAALRNLNPQWAPGADISGLRHYPGSPLLTAMMLRPQDRLVACELHEEDFRELKYKLHQYPQAQAHNRDGYEALRAFLPPAEGRGLTLIDPPYEKPDEFQQLAKNVAEAHKRWPNGQFMLWYPIKERPAVWRFHEELAATGIPKQLCAEFVFHDEVRGDRLNGSGLILINPPWQMDKKIEKLYPALHKAMGTNVQTSTVKWLVKE